MERVYDVLELADLVLELLLLGLLLGHGLLELVDVAILGDAEVLPVVGTLTSNGASRQ